MSEEGHVEAEEDRLLAEVPAGRRETFPSGAVRPDSARSGPAKHLVGLSAGASLVVVGRHGRPQGLVGRLGSVSQAVVQHARCPVAVVSGD
ncbi:universal stress protein [Streptacidiphilus sp. MAP5-3]|uniref:universal stress protein n=1 Tax=unclassified Streptacidiphilus TaxID=2643834 RepID=UPI0035112F2B